MKTDINWPFNPIHSLHRAFSSLPSDLSASLVIVDYGEKPCTFISSLLHFSLHVGHANALSLGELDSLELPGPFKLFSPACTRRLPMEMIMS
jgi:hypothetical protein